MKRPTENVTTTPAGAVEVEVLGSGAPVLVLHGSPGGIDQARAMSRFLGEDQFKTICVSRPGYLGTPLDPTDPSIDHEADLLLAVLDALGVTRVSVLAYSGGGPSAYRLAIRHPGRVSALVAIAAVGSRYVPAKATASDRFVFGTRTGQRLVEYLARRSPGRLVGSALASEGSIRGDELKAATASAMADPEQRAAVLAISTTAGWRGPRKAGWNNDVANFGAIDTLELDRVRCPVLLIHGDADTDVTIDFSYSAHTALPDSTLVVMERGTHLAFYAHPQAPDVQAQARNWLAGRA